jgi:TolB-like protein/class 3 adenylate cyclase/Flp pilus assembly protein TadD
MSAEGKKEIELEIAHVLFIDIVGYSKLSINEQRAAIDELTQVVRASKQVHNAEAAARLIKIPTGDGMALVFYKSPEEPVKCALEICRALKEHPKLQLRMGVHSGPVSGVIDVNSHANLAGAGLNTAQRVMACGDAGHILVSRRVADDLGEYEHWRPLLHDLGECEVKHGAHVTIVNFYGDEVGNPQLPKKFQALKKHSTRMRWATTTAALFALAAMIAGIAMFSRHPVQPRLAVPEKSIAVLPFENRSEEKANAYFVAGMQDEILTALAKISDLKVISRTSSAKYNSHPDNLKATAQELGVATILEGSVQKSGEAVHINVQLISGHNDAHVWAESYDRDLKNVFDVQREVAETVAGHLNAKLSPQEATELARVPTSNPQAYDLYLRGKYIDQQFWNAQVDSNGPALDFYRQAIMVDPGFALAYAALANAELKMYRGGEDRSSSLIADAQANTEKSLALQPDLIEGHLARAAIYSHVKDDDANALVEYESLLKRSPNDSMLNVVVAYAKGQAGNPQAALSGMQRACELDPRNPQYLRWLGNVHVKLRRYAEADQIYEKAQSLAPDDWIARVDRVLTMVDQGKLVDARTAMKAWPDTKLTETALSIKYSTLQAIETLSRNYDAALADALKIPAMGNRVWTPDLIVGDIKKNTDIGYDERYKGDAAGAQKAFTAARESLESQRGGHVDDPDFYDAQALIAAGMENREAAAEAARKAVALMPIEKNAYRGAGYLLTLAHVYAHFGDADRAVPLIAKLLDLPLSGDTITPALLSLDPIWDPIRNDPRFQKLASTAPKTADK